MNDRGLGVPGVVATVRLLAAVTLGDGVDPLATAIDGAKVVPATIGTYATAGDVVLSVIAGVAVSCDADELRAGEARTVICVVLVRCTKRVL